MGLRKGYKFRKHIVNESFYEEKTLGTVKRNGHILIRQVQNKLMFYSGRTDSLKWSFINLAQNYNTRHSAKVVAKTLDVECEIISIQELQKELKIVSINYQK